MNIEKDTEGSIVFDERVFHVKSDCALLHEVVRWQLAKRRSGTRKTKSISEIKATTRKPHRQKGTGRARQGSLCSPQFRGGAVIFGPVVRSHSFSLNKKIRKKAIAMALSQKLAQKEILIFEESLPSIISMTGINKKILFVSDDAKFDRSADGEHSLFIDGVCSKISKNERYSNWVNILPCDAINVYSIIDHDYVVLTRNSIKKINERLV